MDEFSSSYIYASSLYQTYKIIKNPESSLQPSNTSNIRIT